MPSVKQDAFNLYSLIVYAAQLLVLVGAAWYALMQAREARKLREQQFRPFVIVDIEEDNRILEIVVRNVGLTMARDVTFSIEPSFVTSMGDYDLNATKLFERGIRTFAPGKEYRTLFDTLVQRSQMKLEREYVVTVKYSDPSGKRKFVDESLLDIGIYHDFMYRDETGVKDVVKELKEINKTVKSWSSSIGGLKIMNPEQQREENDRYVRRSEERQRRWEESQGGA